MNFGTLLRPIRGNSLTFQKRGNDNPRRETTTAARENPDGRDLRTWCWAL
jgi:hypothetical protein